VGFSELIPCSRGGGGGTDERTIAKNVYVKLLFARKAMKFITTKVLRRFSSVSFVSDLRKDRASHVHSAAPSISTLIIRCRQRVDQNFLRTINERWDVLRTKMIEPLTRMFATAVSRCVNHSLKLIATAYVNQ